MKKQFIITLTALSFLCINCKPKSAEKEVSGVDSLSTAKDTAVSIKKIGGIFFKATGTEPFWGIEIAEDSLRFTSPDEKKNFAVAYKAPVKAMDASVISYQSGSESISLKVTIQQGKCSDGMSDKEHSYKVSVSLKRAGDKDFTALEGCGNYIVDYRLHDIWALEELEGKKVSREDFDKELPNIEINSAEASFIGFAGCNRMGGKLFSEKDLLRFTDIFTTEMMCPNYDKEKQLVKALQSTTRFEIKNNRLYLFNPDGTKAIFRKVD